ncbi:ABC transporter substrate-binding protein [Actinoplanes sp. ATCC 53533]|uniref:ABC transporter substrate-binding protein n=1 Tax=Actinoplanes sp. ATCC 53533 TaxID=1288362 RepID=UPI000F78F00F|nr:ABC transporter substrate-binding protein [Actinoplanes sp. ATCC 53533]
MIMSRRSVLGLGVAGACAGLGAGCGDGTAASEAGTTALWSWPGGLSEKVLADAVTQFAGRTELKVSVLSGDYKQQLLAVLDREQDVPDIVGIKGEDIASLLPRADRFVDLNTLGAAEVQDDYLRWKWQQGSTFDGRLVGFPIDIGPTAMFYRADVFRRAGLPDSPERVDTLMASWPKFLEVGRRIVKAVPGVRLLASGTQVFAIRMSQGSIRFVDASNHFVGDQPHVRAAWDCAVRLGDWGLSAKVQSDEEAWREGIAGGTLAAELGAAWHALDLQQTAPDTAGLWRVAAGPAAGANSGGSFLAIPAAAHDPAQSFAVIRWLLSPENQARAFVDAGLFPSTPAAYEQPGMTQPEEFFGGQRTVEVFGESAKKAPRAYEAPSDSTLAQVYADELDKVETGAKASAQGWQDAVAQARSMATSLGVS